MLANDHDGKVYIITPNGGGGWLWDMSAATRDDLVQHYGMNSNACYCPSNPSHNLGVFWNCPGCGGASVGYWMLVQRANADGTPITTGGWAAGPNNGSFFTYTGDPRYAFVYDLINSADPTRTVQLMLCDAILSDASSPPNYSVPSTIAGAGMNNSAHFDSRHVPMGSNLTFTDGHAEWKDFPQLKRRYAAGGTLDPGKLFWW
jgi:hypothetical protein